MGKVETHIDALRADFSRWMRRTAMAASVHCYSPDGVYYGPQGAKRLGRECGPALLDFGEFGIKNIGATYGGICVIAYHFRPPIDAKDWFTAVREGYDRAKAWDRREVPELHDWRNDPATERQLAYIQEMHEFSVFPIPEFTGKTKGEASDYINQWSKQAHEGFDFSSYSDNYGDRI